MSTHLSHDSSQLFWFYPPFYHSVSGMVNRWLVGFMRPTDTLFGFYTMLFKFWIICQSWNIRIFPKEILIYQKILIPKFYRKIRCVLILSILVTEFGRGWFPDVNCILHFFQNLVSLTFTLIVGLLHTFSWPLSPLGFLFCDSSCSRIFYSKQILLIHSLKYIVRFPTSCIYSHCASHLNVLSWILLQNSSHFLKPSSNAIFTEIWWESLLLLSKLLRKFVPVQTYTKGIFRKNKCVFLCPCLDFLTTEYTSRKKALIYNSLYYSQLIPLPFLGSQ